MDAPFQLLLIEIEIVYLTMATLLGSYLCNIYMQDPSQAHVALIKAFIVCLLSPILKVVDICFFN